MILNLNIDAFKCLVKRSYFTKKEIDNDIFDNCYAFAIQSIADKILTFHIMTDYGMLRSRVTLSEIYKEKPKKDIPFHFKQLWDCFSPNVSSISYNYLSEKRCKVVLKDRSHVWCTYMFTVDWYDNPYSDEPTDYKCGHILVADDGYLLCQPNNRIMWKDSNWITEKFPCSKSDIKVDSEFLSVESMSDRWVSENTDSFYYNINETTDESAQH